MTKEQVLKALNDCEVMRIKLIGKLELLEEQYNEKNEESNKTEQSEPTGL
jgi:hypothetical protein